MTKIPAYINGKKTRTYQSWCNMRNRCLNPRSSQYRWYKHITICERWSSYQAFYEDMGERPEGKTLDRKESSKGYFKESCKWSNHEEQIGNRSCVTLVKFNGQFLPLTTVARLLGISSSTVQHRFKNQKLTVKEALGLDR